MISSNLLVHALNLNKEKYLYRLTNLKFIGGRYVGQVRVKQMIDGEEKTIKPTLYIIRNHKQYDNMEPQLIAGHYKPFPYAWIDGKK